MGYTRQEWRKLYIITHLSTSSSVPVVTFANHPLLTLYKVKFIVSIVTGMPNVLNTMSPHHISICVNSVWSLNFLLRVPKYLFNLQSNINIKMITLLN